MVKTVKQTCWILSMVVGVCTFLIGIFVGMLVKPQAQAPVVPQNTVSQLVQFVDRAAALVTEKQEGAFSAFKQQNGPWWNGDQYIFAYDLQGKTLVLPPTPNVEGTSRWSTQDTNGVYFVREMAQQLQNHDSTWEMYTYPKPGETVGSPKLAYVRKVKLGNTYIFVGSGVYY